MNNDTNDVQDHDKKINSSLPITDTVIYKVHKWVLY